MHFNVRDAHENCNTARRSLLSPSNPARYTSLSPAGGYELGRAHMRGRVVVSGLIVLSLALGGCAAAPEPPKAEVKKSPTASPVVQKTFEQRVEEAKIEAGLSAKEYAETFQDRLNSWALAGASTDEDYENWFEAGGTIEYEDSIAASQTAIYTNALFGPGYQNEPNLVNAEANFTDRNAAWLGRWMRSYDYENDKGTLEIGTVVEQAEVISENPDTNERVIYIAGYDTNNAADAKFNNEDTRQNALDANGQSWDHTLTLKAVDGVEYITKWED